ncbi:Uncharacterised protein [Bordetella pertussis]|nr:Uncharacterised protein [Bordetella pertussis]
MSIEVRGLSKRFGAFPGARPGRRAARAAAGRAVRRAGRQGAQGAAPLAAPAARRAACGQRLRHPRPGGSPGSDRPRRSDERRTHRASGLAARGLGAAGHAIRVRLPGRRQPAAWPCHARRVAPGRGGAAGAGPARGRQPARHRLCASARYRPGPRGHGRSRHPGAPEPRVPGRTQRLPRTGAPGRSGHHRGASA